MKSLAINLCSKYQKIVLINIHTDLLISKQKIANVNDHNFSTNHLLKELHILKQKTANVNDPKIKTNDFLKQISSMRNIRY